MPHRFKVGQQVKVAGSMARKQPKGIFRIVRCLPPDDHDNLYRIKSEAETHERVVAESKLMDLDHTTLTT